jgi:fibronectin type 3 domain-containing protein
MFYINKTRTLLFLLTTLCLVCLLIGCNDSDSDSNKNEDDETVWYKDADGDGYGDPSASLVQAVQPAGYVNNASDCADYTADIYPGAVEVCDGKDNNCNGEVDENACGPQSQKISGRITNINDAQAYITGDSYLQLIAYPEDGQLPFTTDTQGRRVYASNLTDIDVPSNGTFVFEAYGLPPGQYVIAAQSLEPYAPESEESPILSAAGNQPAIIVISANENTPFEIDLGNVILPVPAPIIDNQTGPAPPTGVSASDGAFEDKIRVTWNVSDGATNYEVYRAASFAGQQVKIATTNGTVYDDTSLPCGVDYYYWIRAKNASGASDLFYNDLGFIRCPAPPVTPDEDPIDDPEDPTDKPVTLSAPIGTNASDGTFAFKIRITWNAVSGATSYDVYRCQTCCDTKIKIGSATATTFDDTDVPLHSYYYWVKANNAISISEFSLPDTGYTMLRPDTPNGLSASDGTYLNKVLVTWNQTPTASSYEVYRSSWSGSTKTLIGTATTNNFYDTDLECSTCCVDSFVYSVIAVNEAGKSYDFSNEDSGYVYRTLHDPGNVTATDGTLVGCVLTTWITVTDAKRYDIYRSDSENGVKTLVGTIDHPCNRFSDSTTTCPKTYYYWVKSIDANGYTSCTFGTPDTGYCSSEENEP